MDNANKKPQPNGSCLVATQGQMALLKRCKQFFAPNPGKNQQQLSAEFKALTEEDKRELAELLNDAGMPTAPPSAATATPSTSD